MKLLREPVLIVQQEWRTHGRPPDYDVFDRWWDPVATARYVDDEEVRSLLANGVPESAPALSSIGYRQVLPLIAGSATQAEVTRQIETDTHRLVRHQQTWFRKNPRLIRIDASGNGWTARAERIVRSHCRAWLAE